MRLFKLWTAGLLPVWIIGGVAAPGFGANTDKEGKPSEFVISAEIWAAIDAAGLGSLVGTERARFEVEQARIEEERRLAEVRRVEAIRAKVSPFGLSWPHVNAITSYWGYRHSGFHHGMDIRCSTGEPIYAAVDGLVTTATTLPLYGVAVILQSGANRTLYAHMSRLSVVAGQQVRRGQQIGLCGSTGNSTGPHLHFEVYINGQVVNPLPRLPAWT